MCDVTQKHMDRLLFAIKHDSLEVGYKAILTKPMPSGALRKCWCIWRWKKKIVHFKIYFL